MCEAAVRLIFIGRSIAALITKIWPVKKAIYPNQINRDVYTESEPDGELAFWKGQGTGGREPEIGQVALRFTTSESCGFIDAERQPGVALDAETAPIFKYPD